MSAERIGGLLARLEGLKPGEVYPENTECGGALLKVSRTEAKALAELWAAKGFRWRQDPERIPEDGRHDCRVACRGEVLSVARTAELPPDASAEQRANAPKYRITYGLCGQCCSYERAWRTKLRRDAKKAEEDAKRVGPRRRGFAEKAGEET